MLGGPWSHRLAARRAWVDALPWNEGPPPDPAAARWAWTQTTHSEYAAAAAFSAISSALLAAGAPIDLVAVSGDFVVDELVHVEVSARIAAHLGGGVLLEVDLERLVRPPTSKDPRIRAAELIVRACCVGESMTTPLLDHSRRRSSSTLISEALRHIMKDEVPHAQLGGWFLEWADGWLDDAARAHLGRVAGQALRAFSPLLCVREDSAVGPDDADRTFADAFAKAARERVARPLLRYGIEVPNGDMTAVGATP
jgi:hypothetical protein